MSKWLFFIIRYIGKFALESEIFGFSRLWSLGVGFVFALGFLGNIVDGFWGTMFGCDAFHCLTEAMEAHASCMAVAYVVGRCDDGPVDLVEDVSEWLEA